MSDPAAPRARRRVVVAVTAVAVSVATVVIGVVFGVLPLRGSSGPTAVGITGSGSQAAATSSSVPSSAGAASRASGRSGRTLVGLGDSVPSADTCGCTGYVTAVGRLLEKSTSSPWVVRNDAMSGWTTADVSRDLMAPSTRADLDGADLVIVEVGANDFDLSKVGDSGCLPVVPSACWTSTLAAFSTSLTSIVDGIRREDGRPDVHIALLGYWNVTVDGAVGRARGPDFVLGSDALTRVVNATVKQVADATGVDYVDTYTPLKGDSGTQDPTSDLLEDGDHLDASGHALVASAIVAELNGSRAVAGWKEGG